MLRRYRFILVACAAPVLLSAAGPTGPDAAVARTATARLPLRFEANQGQFDPTVRYAARTSAYSVVLTAHGASLLFPGSPRISLSLAGSAASPLIDPEEPMAVRTDYMIG